MYVGSSSKLARRLIGYFKGTHADTGKFIPLLNKEGVGAPFYFKSYSFIRKIPR